MLGLNEYADKNYGHLRGATITGVEVQPDREWGFGANRPRYIIHIELPGGVKSQLEAWADAEGNGPGFLFSQHQPA